MNPVIHPYISHGCGSADLRFRITDPDPGGQLHNYGPTGSGSRSRTLVCDHYHSSESEKEAATLDYSVSSCF
jgi:hypothetical protein